MSQLAAFILLSASYIVFVVAAGFFWLSTKSGRPTLMWLMDFAPDESGGFDPGDVVAARKVALWFLAIAACCFWGWMALHD